MKIEKTKFIKKANYYHKRNISKVIAPDGRVHYFFHIHIGHYCFSVTI